MFEFIDVLCALLAGVIFTIIMIVLDVPLVMWLANLILIMILMLFVGYVYKTYIKKYIFKEPDKVLEEVSIEEVETLDEETENIVTNFEEDDEEDYDQYDQY